MIDPPDYITYSSIIPHDFMENSLVMATLNGLYILEKDIGNAFLNVPCY